MSSFMTTAKNKLTGQTHLVECLDNFFGRYSYGYRIDNGVTLRKRDFDKEYELMKEEKQ